MTIHMKKNILYRTLLWGGLVLGAFSACNRAPKELTFEEITRNETVELCDDEHAPTCDIHLELAFAQNEDSVAQSINESIIRAVFNYEHLQPEVAVDSFVANYIHTYRKELLPYYKEDKQSDANSMSWYSYYYHAEGETEQGVEGVVNYKLDVEGYEGGAHGYHTTIYLNFQLTDGHLMTLSEIFNEGYEADLSALLLDKLMEKMKVKSLGELQEMGFLVWTDMYPSSNFLLKEDEIVFLYNAYEIAPYAAGTTVLKIPYTELTDLLKSE